LIIRVELVEMLNKTPYTREEVCKELEITVCILPTLVFLCIIKLKRVYSILDTKLAV